MITEKAKVRTSMAMAEPPSSSSYIYIKKLQNNIILSLHISRKEKHPR